MSPTPEPVFVDTNVFLRYLTGDDPEQAPRARSLMSQAERGEVQLVTTALTIAEIVRVLESVYDVDRRAIRAKVVAILGQPGLMVQHQEALLQAIVWYEEKSVDFADAYSAAWMEREGLYEVYTFDQDFDRFEELTPRQPG
jgi:predicted nucleic acid-binding protein